MYSVKTRTVVVEGEDHNSSYSGFRWRSEQSRAAELEPSLNKTSSPYRQHSESRLPDEGLRRVQSSRCEGSVPSWDRPDTVSEIS